jgi:hypothetical protein
MTQAQDYHTTLVHNIFTSLIQNDIAVLALHWLKNAIAGTHRHSSILARDPNETASADQIKNVQAVFELVLFAPFKIALDTTTLYLFGIDSPDISTFGIQRTALSESTQTHLHSIEDHGRGALFFNRVINIGMTMSRYSDFLYDEITDEYPIRQHVSLMFIMLLLQNDFKSDYVEDMGRTIIGIITHNIISDTYDHTVKSEASGRSETTRVFDMFDIKTSNQLSRSNNNAKQIDYYNSCAVRASVGETLSIMYNFTHMLDTDPSRAMTMALAGSNAPSQHKLSTRDYSRIESKSS